MKVDIDKYLDSNIDLKNDITKIAEQYVLNDFVYLGEKLEDIKRKDTYSYIIDIRKKAVYYPPFGTSISRLRDEYCELLNTIINDQSVLDKVFYIVAYHVLSIGQQYGYDLTEAHQAQFGLDSDGKLFPDEIAFMDKWDSVHDDDYYTYYIKQEDIQFFRNILLNYDYHSANTKHFSLIAEYIRLPRIINNRYFIELANLAIEHYVFHYRIAITTYDLSPFATKEEKNSFIDKIIP